MNQYNQTQQLAASAMASIGDEVQLRRVLRAGIDNLLAETPPTDRRGALDRLEHAVLFRYSRKRILEGVRGVLLDDDTALAIEDEARAAARRWWIRR